MKSIRIALSIALILLTTVAFPLTDVSSSAADARKLFKKLKTLAGSWESDNPKQPLSVSFRVTSNGHSILSEMEAPPDNMVTMYHLDGDRLLMTHYCAAGNQPRMVGKLLPDDKTVEFDFVDATNLNDVQDGHMHRLRITMTDEGHHSEDLIFQTKDGKQLVPVHFNMHRTK